MIAIDPGTNGGLAVALPGEGVTAFHMPPTSGELLRKLKQAQASEANTAYLEDVVKFVPRRTKSGQELPSSRMIVYGMSWGRIEGMLMALEFRVILVSPQKWQKALGLGTSRGMNKTIWKNKLKAEAERLYPSIDVTLATADALLILEAAKRGTLG
jgi:hypothetical protein